MKKFTIAFFSISLLGFAQDPAIEWQKTIGGSGSDVFSSLEPTADGGYILGGYSASGISGDKTENSNGALDLWIVKINSSGAIQWQNTIGGSGDDFLNSVKQTADGGYIVLAGSDSDISGDKTENSRGGLDYWILKLDSTGAIQWQKTYGGSSPDFDTFGQQTSDGGYLVAGYSDSGISGEKTQASNGQRDFWILKLDSNGNISWQNGIGGSLVDRVQAALQTADGGYMIGGFSSSPISGDKTEANYGGTDYWVVKLDSTGDLVWQNTIGGSAADALRDVIQTTDGGYLLGGYSLSNVSGEKTENSNGDADYWIVKLSSSGAIQWQNTIGGANTDFLRDIKQTNDGNYVIAGYSNSGVSGDKNEASNGGYDYWLLRLDQNGTITAQNSIGGGTDESGPYILALPDGSFMMACSSDSNQSGDKSENGEGLEDYWVFKVSSAILAVPENRLEHLIAYPNPVKDSFNIALAENFEKIDVTIANLSGQTVFEKRYADLANLQVDFTAPSGLYFVTVASGNQRHTMKIAKE